MAAKVETLRVNSQIASSRPDFVTKVAVAAKRWAQRGQLGSSTAEMRAYTGAR